MAITDFQYVMRFRVPFHDIDMMQHVNNASYVVWAETFAVITLRKYLEKHYRGASGVTAARVEMNYEQPPRLPRRCGHWVPRQSSRTQVVRLLSRDFERYATSACCAGTRHAGRFRLRGHDVDSNP